MRTGVAKFLILQSLRLAGQYLERPTRGLVGRGTLRRKITDLLIAVLGLPRKNHSF